jgi:heat shock protein HslJ
VGSGGHNRGKLALVRLAVCLTSLLVCAGVVAGCGGDGGGEASDIENRPWQLASGKDITLAEGIVASAVFTGGNVFGSSGCNQYRGPYTLDGDSLEIGKTSSTLKACPPPADEIEHAYLAALGQVASWEIDGEELVLSDADGNELLRFEVASIIGDWTVTGILDGNAFSSPIAGTELTATFAEDGMLTGSAGCNNYTTAYTADTGDIEIEPPASTKKLCPEPEGIMNQEAAYLAALAEATQYGFNGATMELSDADGTRLVSFARAQP